MRDINEKREREKRIVTQIIELYCRKKHGGRELCPKCRELAEYGKQDVLFKLQDALLQTTNASEN